MVFFSFLGTFANTLREHGLGISGFCIRELLFEDPLMALEAIHDSKVTVLIR